MKTKIFGIVLMFLVGLVALGGLANAQIDDSSIRVYFDNILLEEGNASSFEVIERGETLPLKVQFVADDSTGAGEDLQVEVEIKGDLHGDVIASGTDVFDVKEGGRYTKKLNLQLTKRMEPGVYDVKVRIDGRTRDISITKYYSINVDTAEHLVDIKDVLLSPAGIVKAGRSLIATVRVENNGARDEEGVKVQVSIPELGLTTANYIDVLEAEGDDDSQTTSEELFMRIPDCAEAGEYDVNVVVTYDDGDEKTSTTKSIMVIPGDTCELDVQSGDAPAAGPQTVIKVQDVSNGGASSYQMTITNNGNSAKIYTIKVEGGDKLDATIQPSNTLIVNPKDSESVIVFVNGKQGVAAGQYGFSITVSSGSDVLKQIPLTANVQKATGFSGTSLKRGLEIGLVVLVVLLVILGLIIGFNKLKGEEEEDSESTKTYY